MSAPVLTTHDERPSSAGSPAQRRSPEDRQACELLFAFARMARGPKQAHGLPKHIEDLVQRGVLAPRHLGAFAVISLDGPISVTQLSAHLCLALSTTSLLVTQLADVGLVERHEDSEDRRRTVVSIAPRFRRASEEVLESKLAPLRRVVARLGPQRARALIQGLQMLAEEVAVLDDTGNEGAR